MENKIIIFGCGQFVHDYFSVEIEEGDGLASMDFSLEYYVDSKALAE